MEKITIQGRNNSSVIVVGESLRNLSAYIPQNNVFLITDTHVAAHYNKWFPDFPVYVITPGEASKDLKELASIFEWLLLNGADRSSFIVGIGGGVVCDIAGFVASTFMRGIPFGFVASSLLAQVDASVGGKNGVNLKGYKNIIGTFTQPHFVLCDTGMLHTLPEEEFRNGMAEVIKHALISDREKFEWLQRNRNTVLQRNESAINYIVSRSVKIKAAVVQTDELEKGQRRLLNFGHTWGHAIEKVSKIPHGQAVAAGMVFAASLSVQQEHLHHDEREAIMNLINDYGLPVVVELDPEKVFDAMLKDKKRERQTMHFVLLQAIGEAFVKEIDLEVLKEFAL
ncbi:MAG: 3-dehydroquinate synthase [Bacteroidota bacterium]